MTEARANVRATGAGSPPPLSASGSAPASKLRPTAKEFVFNSSAPAWTPTAAPAPAAAVPAPSAAPVAAPAPVPEAVAAAEAAPASKSSVLKPSAKAFVPSFMAPVFVPATIPPPTSAAASPVAPVIVGQRSDAYMKRTTTTTTTSTTSSASISTAATSSSATSSSSAIVSTTTTTATSMTSEPEAEDRADANAEEETASPVEATAEIQESVAAVQTQVAAPTPVEKKPEPLLRAEATVGINGAVQPAELPRAPVSTPVVSAPAAQEEVKEQAELTEAETPASIEEPKETEETKVAAEQEVIKERILYTIKQLLELEPENCPMPPGVKGMVVAADKTSKTSVTLAEAPSRRENSSRDGSNGGSRRSLSRHNSSSSYGGDNGGRGRRDRGGRGRGGRGGHHDTAPALEDCEPLKINEETRWKPSVAKSRLDDPTDTSDASLKEAKSILNKLSIEKFDKLSDQLILVAVRGLEVLKGVIEMVIEKAQMEWHFSAMYAELCAKLAKTSMPAITLEDNEVVTDTHKLFRKLLLQRCQKEFEDKPSVVGLEELTEEARQEKELLVKRATLGHIRFVGELFKQRMLSSRIMHECISILFGDLTAPDEESLECLCKLLSTIGQALEQNVREQGERDHINKYYATMKQLSGDSKLLCTRVRFMLQDLLELRRNNWVARRKETKAMTIAEVHAEVAREAKEKEKAAKSSGGARLQRSQSMNSTGGSDRRRGSQGSNGGAASSAWKARAASSSNLAGLASAPSSSSSAAPPADDGWSTVTGGAKPKLLKSRSNSDRFPSSMNGPASGAPRHPNSARGVGSNNAFASLRQDERPSRKERSRSNSASSNSSRGGIGRPPMSSPSQKSTSPSRDSSDALSSSSSTPEPLSAEAFGKKAKAILEEFVELRDLDEAVASLNELNSSKHHSLLASQALNLGLEKGDKEREAVAELLAGLQDQDLLSTDGLMVALDELLEFVEDMEIDIPRTLPYLSEMLAPTVAAGSLPLPRLVSSVQHMTYNGKAAKLVGGTLAAIGDEDKVRALVVVDDIHVVEFDGLLADDKRGDEAALQTFYEAYKLQFLQ